MAGSRDTLSKQREFAEKTGLQEAFPLPGTVRFITRLNREPRRAPTHVWNKLDFDDGSDDRRSTYLKENNVIQFGTLSFFKKAA
jgi:hypothetical protein